MHKSWFDRITFAALVLAITLVSFSASQNWMLKDRLRRLEEHRAALDQYEATRSKWEQEKEAERESRLRTSAWQGEVMDRLDSLGVECRHGADR